MFVEFRVRVYKKSYAVKYSRRIFWFTPRLFDRFFTVGFVCSFGVTANPQNPLRPDHNHAPSSSPVMGIVFVSPPSPTGERLNLQAQLKLLITTNKTNLSARRHHSFPAGATRPSLWTLVHHSPASRPIFGSNVLFPVLHG